MPKHDIIVIGTSSGGVEALQSLAGQLPADFAGALFVVIHLAPGRQSFLPGILERSGRLPAQHVADGQKIETGRIYVAPPDHHVIIERDQMRLSLGPKEQHQRPSINVAFRAAAAAYGERVVGVVLTGELDDGTAGLCEIKRRGGIAVVQNPEQAAFPSMPLSALRQVEADYVVEIGKIGELLTRLASGSDGKRTEVDSSEMKPQGTDGPDTVTTD